MKIGWVGSSSGCADDVSHWPSPRYRAHGRGRRCICAPCAPLGSLSNRGGCTGGGSVTVFLEVGVAVASSILSTASLVLREPPVRPSGRLHSGHAVLRSSGAGRSGPQGIGLPCSLVHARLDMGSVRKKMPIKGWT